MLWMCPELTFVVKAVGDLVTNHHADATVIQRPVDIDTLHRVMEQFRHKHAKIIK